MGSSLQHLIEQRKNDYLQPPAVQSLMKTGLSPSRSINFVPDSNRWVAKLKADLASIRKTGYDTCGNKADACYIKTIEGNIRTVRRIRNDQKRTGYLTNTISRKKKKR